MRAFYTIYDGDSNRIGLVGDTSPIDSLANAVDDESDSGASFNPLIYILPGAIIILCVLAICITVCVTNKLRKHQISL